VYCSRKGLYFGDKAEFICCLPDHDNFLVKCGMSSKNVEGLIEHQKISHNVEYSPEFFEQDHTMSYDPLDISVHEEKMPKEQQSKLEFQEIMKKSNGFPRCEKKYQCSICLKMFKTKYYVTKHIERVHGGKKPPIENQKTEFERKPDQVNVGKNLESDTVDKRSASGTENENFKNLGNVSVVANVKSGLE
jgi:hypothetical protein